jgi:hypothetical protein
MTQKVSDPPGSRMRSRSPHLTDVVFRLGTACFALWVVISSATSPVTNLRPTWWPVFLVIGGLIAVTMLVGALMSLAMYLRNR